MWFFEDEKRSRDGQEQRSASNENRGIENFQEKSLDHPINYDESLRKLSSYPY